MPSQMTLCTHCMLVGDRSDACKTPASAVSICCLKRHQTGFCKAECAPAVVALVLGHIGAAVAHQQICPQCLPFGILHHENMPNSICLACLQVLCRKIPDFIALQKLLQIQKGGDAQQLPALPPSPRGVPTPVMENLSVRVGSSGGFDGQFTGLIDAFGIFAGAAELPLYRDPPACEPPA